MLNSSVLIIFEGTEESSGNLLTKLQYIFLNGKQDKPTTLGLHS